MTSIPQTMKAAVIEEFGGVDEIEVRSLPLPKIRENQVLVKVDSAGLGIWDAAEREGVFAKSSGSEPSFPAVLGGEGAGTVVAVGEKAGSFKEGDRVYGVMLGRDGGFDAEYAALDADRTWPVPKGLDLTEAGATPIDAATAWRGLRDELKIESGQSLLILGASGGIGHMAVQMAKRRGARVFAVASGEDGVSLARNLGADQAVDGHAKDMEKAARAFAPEGFDAALLTTGGKIADKVLKLVRDGGRAAYPNGVRPAPEADSRIELAGYNAVYDAEFMADLGRLIAEAPFEVKVERTYLLDDVAAAHRALGGHHVGRLAVRP